MSQLILQKANSDDLITLQKISIETFSSTYSSLNSEENMQLYVSESLSEMQLMAELVSSSTSFYLAYKDSCLIGYCKLNFPDKHKKPIDKNSMEIERIYLLEKYHGKGYGKDLFESIIKIARARNIDRIWLAVWSKNTAAIKFYKKLGFIKFDQHLFKLGKDEQLDYLLELTI
jgi:ribosomal protein S18 acetylase RimI-like enzyme